MLTIEKFTNCLFPKKVCQLQLQLVRNRKKSFQIEIKHFNVSFDSIITTMLILFVLIRTKCLFEYFIIARM